MTDKVIYGEKVYIRPITIEDTNQVLAWRNSKEVVSNFIYREPISYDEHVKWLRTKVDTGLVEEFVVCEMDTHKPVGVVYLQNFDKESNSGESGIFMSKESKGRGLGIEAYILLIKFGFHEKKLHKIKARVLEYNVASNKMHERAGYSKEACLRDEVCIDGKYVNLIMWGILNK